MSTALRVAFTCQEALPELWRIADDKKLAVGKKKERQLVCEKSLMSESHQDITRVMARNDHDLSERRKVLRIRAEPAAHTCELETGRNLRSLRSEPPLLLMEG